MALDIKTKSNNIESKNPRANATRYNHHYFIVIIIYQKLSSISLALDESLEVLMKMDKEKEENKRKMTTKSLTQSEDSGKNPYISK